MPVHNFNNENINNFHQLKSVFFLLNIIVVFLHITHYNFDSVYMISTALPHSGQSWSVLIRIVR